MRCLVCSNRRDFQALRPQLCQTDNYLCGKCGLVFIPRRARLNQQYYKEGGYFTKSPNVACRKVLFSKGMLVREARKRLKRALEMMGLILSKKSVLDIGCGYGEVLYAFKRGYGCKVMGIEPSSETASYGSKIFGLPIRATLLEEFSGKEKFDLIWSSHTLEHVADPSAFLAKVKRLIKKDGYLYIEVPNVLKPTGGFDLNLFLYNEHLQTFSAYNLYLLLKKQGFKVVAYSEADFLRFWSRISSDKDLVLPKITAAQIMDFLVAYKQKYNLGSYLKVFSQKAAYALQLVVYKAYDLIVG